jgi:hypothetical protein
MARRFIVNRRPTSRQMDRQNPVLQPNQREGRLRRRISPGQPVGRRTRFPQVADVGSPRHPRLTSGLPGVVEGLFAGRAQVPRPSLLVRWLGGSGAGGYLAQPVCPASTSIGRNPMPRIFLSQKIADVRFRAMACLLRQRTRYRCCSVWDETQAWSFQEYRNRSISRRSGCRG